MRIYPSLTLASLGLAVLSHASLASAHIRMLEPAARYAIEGFDTGIKSCPCGLGSSNRTCNLAVDGSDPQRSSNVSRFEAGSTITLRFEEYVDHAGRFRVAFDPDGADMADFNTTVLADIPDPAGTGSQVWEMQVTLPNMTCDNCTLQLVQAMEVDVDTPIADPAPISSYYSCVDLELVAPGTLGQPGVPAEQPPEQPPAEQPPAEQPAAAPPGEVDGAAADAGAASDAEPSGASAAGAAETPLIPAGGGAPMDTGSSGSAAPAGEIAMNDVGAAAPGAVGMPPAAPPSLAGSGSESAAAGGCGLTRAPSSDARGLLALGLLAAFAARRRRAT